MDAEMSKRVLDEFLKKTEDGFIVVDKEGIIREINENYCDFLARGRDEIIGRPINEVISTTSMLDVLKKRYAGDGNNVYVHPYKPGETRDDEEVYAAANRFCIFDDQDQLLGAAAHMKFRQRALDTSQKYRETELNYYKQEYQDQMQKEGGFANFRGNDPKIQHVKNLGMRIAKTDFPVLITGETGTGKEVIAKSIHMESSRSAEPFVAINCGAIPAELLESELFGYEGGSFTGAKRQGKIGKFEMANKGTFFLDEIGDMPLHMQVKLLRVLQEHEIERVGGNRPIPIDVRIISATRLNLMEMVQERTFREDLYYRLAVVNIQTVPLRACPHDIILHATNYLDQLNQQYKTEVSLSDAAKRCLKAHSWPGNVRELQNVISSAYATCENNMITMDNLPKVITDNHKEEWIMSDTEEMTLKEKMNHLEKLLLEEALHKNKNMTAAAAALGIERSLLYKKLKKHHIEF